MDRETQAVLEILAQAFGPDEARRISGAYRLALTLVRLQQPRQPANGTVEPVEAATVG